MAAVPPSAADEIWGVPLIGVRRLSRSRAGLLAKRACDVIIASCALAIALPVLLVLAIAI